MNSTNIFRQNNIAVTPLSQTKQWMATRKKTCWKCQKDKSTTNGRLIIRTGLHLFVCEDCEKIKQAAARALHMTCTEHKINL